MDKYLKKIGGLDKTSWYLPIIIFIPSVFILTTRLSLIPKRLSATESTTYSNLIHKNYSFNYLIHHITSSLYLVYLVILNYLNLHSLFLIRLSGLICGLLAIFIFFYITKALTNSFISFASTILFATSVWFLQIVRNSLNLDFYSFVILLAIYLSILYYRKKNLRLLALASSILLGLSLYVPGMIWFSIIFIIINFKMLKLETKILPLKIKILAMSFFTILLAPIVYEIVRHHNLIYSVLYLPHSISYHQIFKQFLYYPKYLFVQNSSVTAFSIGRLPIVNFATTILALFSILWIIKHWKNPITKYIYWSLGLDWILSALNHNQSIYIILPLINLLSAIGLSYIYNEWKKIFPRNPYSDFAAKILICILIGVIGFYQILLYFIAWPHTINVLAIYSHHL